MLRLSIRAMRGLSSRVSSTSCSGRTAPRTLLSISSTCSVSKALVTSVDIRLHDSPLRRIIGTCRATASTAGADKPAPDSASQNVSSRRLEQLLKVKLPAYCSGCGVKLQQDHPDEPGFFQIPKRLLELAEEQTYLLGEPSLLQSDVGQGLSAEEKERRSIDRAMEAWLDEQQRPATPVGASVDDDEQQDVSVRCARCFSLTHYGKVKSQVAESVLPDFDLGKKVGRKIALQKDRRALVLCVVDLWDFDGSLPRAALTSLFPGTGGDVPLPADPDDLPFQLAVAVNKFDLLPTQATPRRVEQWVRTRLQQSGLPKPRRVFMVSALNGLGVKEMCRTLKEDMGFRADLWVVGAQNAGKSSLINAMKKLGGTGGRSEPTVAPIPGTTLGLLRVPGIPLGPKHRTFDTPGVHHSYQLTSRLNLDELAAVLPRRRLKPRTYRVPAGSSILIGGLARVDVVSAPSATVYLTVFVSDEIVTHLGKIEGAEQRRENHVGGLLVPPYDPQRLQHFQLMPRTAVVEGNSWKMHSKDIAIAGLGWIAVGCEGSTELQVWAPEGVSVTMHNALVPDFAKVFQQPGFSTLLPTKNLAATKKLSNSSSSSSSRVVDSGEGGAAAVDSSAAGYSAEAAAAEPKVAGEDLAAAITAAFAATTNSSREEDSSNSSSSSSNGINTSSSSSRARGRGSSKGAAGSSSSGSNKSSSGRRRIRTSRSG